MSLKKEVQKLHEEWTKTDTLLKDEILRCVKTVHTAVAEVAGLVPKSLLDQAAKTMMSMMPKLLMGTSIEDVLIEAASAIPELSPYVRQLLGD
jgi:hypothetical protein